MQDTKSQTCSKHELRRKGLCFICKETWGPNHSCLSNTEEMTPGGQEEIPSYFPDEDSPSTVEFVGIDEDTFEEHEQTSDDIDISPDMQPHLTEVYDEQSIDPMGVIQGDELFVVIQHEQHMAGHESEDDMHQCA